MGEYTFKVYGLGRFFDPELMAWREPITAVELMITKRFDEHLKRSFMETRDAPDRRPKMKDG